MTKSTHAYEPQINSITQVLGEVGQNHLSVNRLYIFLLQKTEYLLLVDFIFDTLESPFTLALFFSGKFRQAKNLVMDVVVVAQSRHLIQHLESRSFGK
jgi:hypothetical protein